MARLHEIAKELGAAYRRQKELELATWRQEQDAQGRKLAIVPEDGFPGKNEGERATSRDRLWAADEVLSKITALANEARAEHTSVTIRILELEAERRALEWAIRDGLVQVLSGHTDEAEPVIEVSGTDVIVDMDFPF